MAEVKADETELLVSAIIEGTAAPGLIERRVEGYEVTVGDRTGTLVASFTIERDLTGKITKITRLPHRPSIMTGRFVDLLATRH